MGQSVASNETKHRASSGALSKWLSKFIYSKRRSPRKLWQSNYCMQEKQLRRTWCDKCSDRASMARFGFFPASSFDLFPAIIMDIERILRMETISWALGCEVVCHTSTQRNSVGERRFWGVLGIGAYALPFGVKSVTTFIWMHCCWIYFLI